MITRYNYKWEPPKLIETPVRVEFELITQIEPISYTDESKKIVKEYRENQSWVEHKSKWQDFIESFNIGSISEQVISHITRGTPLITAHTLPPGDYTDESLLKGAQLLREMEAKGITLEMLELASEQAKSEKVNVEAAASSESEAK